MSLSADEVINILFYFSWSKSFFLLLLLSWFLLTQISFSYYFWDKIKSIMPLNSDFGLCLIPGVLTIYTNLIQVEILCMKMKLKNWRGVRTTHSKVYPNQNKLERVEKLHSSKSHAAHVFWSFPNRMAQTIWLSNRDFQFFPFKWWVVSVE